MALARTSPAPRRGSTFRVRPNQTPGGLRAHEVRGNSWVSHESVDRIVNVFTLERSLPQTAAVMDDMIRHAFATGALWMKRYANRGGDSGVVEYQITDTSITVKFRNGSVYLYDDSAPGQSHVEEMKRRAELGEGLNTYISRHVRKNYAARLV